MDDISSPETRRQVCVVNSSRLKRNDSVCVCILLHRFQFKEITVVEEKKNSEKQKDSINYAIQSTSQSTGGKALFKICC